MYDARPQHASRTCQVALDGGGRCCRRIGVGVTAAKQRRDLRQSEVENLGGPSPGDEDVGGLDVAMDDAFGMRRIEGVRDLDPEANDLFDIDRPLGDAVLECRAFEILHDDAGAAVLLADVMNGADVRMVQRGSRARLSLESD